jgi:hypothetical protein
MDCLSYASVQNIPDVPLCDPQRNQLTAAENTLYNYEVDFFMATLMGALLGCWMMF